MKQSLHERMMQSHGGGSGDSDHKGKPKEIASYDIFFKGKKEIAEGTYVFTFSKPDAFTPKAGQHVRVTLIDPPETDAEGNSRFLSFASSPRDKDLIFAMRMRDTAFKRVFAGLQPGDKVLMQMRLGPSPHGSFELQEAADAARPAVFLIGGIGIVPAFSMIKDAVERKQQHKIYLFYANRRPEDAPFLSDLQKMAKQSPFLTVVPIMSEPEKSSQIWQGETGRIDSTLVKKYVTDLQAPIYYVAGLTEMANATQEMLAAAGIRKDSIRAEEFGAFTTAHPTNEGAAQAKKTYLPLIAIVVLIIFMISLHVTGAVSLSHTDLSLRNPMVDLMLVLLLFIIALKVKYVRRFMRGNKQSARSIVKAHKPILKKK
jgi:ferredoxin-NADP reductase